MSVRALQEMLANTEEKAEGVSCDMLQVVRYLELRLNNNLLQRQFYRAAFAVLLYILLITNNNNCLYTKILQNSIKAFVVKSIQKEKKKIWVLEKRTE